MKSLSAITIATIALLLQASIVRGQVFTTIPTNTTGWVCYSTSGINTTPKTFSQILTEGTGLWTAPVTSPGWPDACLDNPLSYPGTPITTPGHANCDPEGNYTSFFRTFFGPGSTNPLCRATIQVRADNFFRLYINGALVAGSSTLSCGNLTVSSVNGNNPNTIYTIDISNFVDPQSTGSMIIIKVGNCSYVNYLAANIIIEQQIVPGPDASFTPSLVGNTLTLAGNANGWTNQTWEIAQGTSFSGPFSVFATHSNRRPGSSWSTTVPPCVFLQVMHRVSYMCGNQEISATATVVIPCEFFAPPGSDEQRMVFTEPTPYSRELALGGLTPVVEMSDEVKASPRNEAKNTATVADLNSLRLYPNPVSSILRVRFSEPGERMISIFNATGERVHEGRYAGEGAELDCWDLPNGMYFIVESDAEGKVVMQRKFAVVH